MDSRTDSTPVRGTDGGEGRALARTRPARRTGGLAALLPGLLVLAVLGAGSSAGAGAASDDGPGPVVDLTVRSGGR